jgi:hypothetical protein
MIHFLDMEEKTPQSTTERGNIVLFRHDSRRNWFLWCIFYRYSFLR